MGAAATAICAGRGVQVVAPPVERRSRRLARKTSTACFGAWPTVGAAWPATISCFATGRGGRVMTASAFFASTSSVLSSAFFLLCSSCFCRKTTVCIRTSRSTFFVWSVRSRRARWIVACSTFTPWRSARRTLTESSALAFRALSSASIANSSSLPASAVVGRPPVVGREVSAARPAPSSMPCRSMGSGRKDLLNLGVAPAVAGRSMAPPPPAPAATNRGPLPSAGYEP
mmetsp:Transcript_25239/g.71984  ORF Transcript_25239/g.71984 Transcript_25239/m.71984 type:complete len:229 (+) Transcript_25239:816-1502(+)